MFVNLCLVYFITMRYWRYNSYKSDISDSFTVTDQALVIILLRNHVDSFRNTISLNRRLTRKYVKTRYAKSDNINKNFLVGT